MLRRVADWGHWWVSFSGGMCGRLIPVEGEEAAPLVVSPPFGGLGDDITANATCCAHFLNPPHQPHVARPLPGQGFEVRGLFRLCSVAGLPLLDTWGCGAYGHHN